MKFLREMILAASVAASVTLPLSGRADVDTNAVPPFKEVYDVIRSHLSGESDADLNRDAVQGLLNQLHAKVSLVADKSTAAAASTNTPTLTKTTVFDSRIAYLRVANVESGLASQVSATCKELMGTNHLDGIVLDLRFAGGQDYAEAATTADLFISSERSLLDWGNGFAQSKTKPDAVTLPLAILVNRETAAAAEALAAVLHEGNRAIILGAPTAGEASMSQTFPLQNGEYLRIATSAIKLGGGDTLSSQGIKPDIEVAVRPEDEKTYYADPYAEIIAAHSVISTFVSQTPGGESMVVSNRVAHPHPLNEAELMRERKANPGVDVEDLVPQDGAQADTEPEKPVIRDPVLGRALDLIKGIAVIRKSQTP